jgi:hypothetical protein
MFTFSFFALPLLAIASTHDFDDIVRFMDDWEQHRFTVPVQVVASYMIEHGIRVDFEQLHRDVALGFPGITIDEVQKIRNSLLRSMVMRPDFHELMFNAFISDQFPSLEAKMDVVQRLLRSSGSGQRPDLVPDALQSVDTWLKYCIIPLRRGRVTCGQHPVVRSDGSSENLWMLGVSATQQYLRDLVQGF